jgi:hypothetical protein
MHPSQRLHRYLCALLTSAAGRTLSIMSTTIRSRENQAADQVSAALDFTPRPSRFSRCLSQKWILNCLILSIWTRRLRHLLFSTTSTIVNRHPHPCRTNGQAKLPRPLLLPPSPLRPLPPHQLSRMSHLQKLFLSLPRLPNPKNQMLCPLQRFLPGRRRGQQGLQPP